jgi:hypothetical protein
MPGSEIHTLQKLRPALHAEVVMRPARYFFPHIRLASVLLLLLPLPIYASKSPRSSFAGIYLSHTGKKGPYMDASLGADGTATITEDPGQGIPVTLFGHWVDSGNEITVRFDPVKGKPPEPPLIFEPTHNGLQATSWNHATWGKVTPPPMKKGYKVKQVYWTTTIPVP